jgi:hypothetical protein
MGNPHLTLFHDAREKRRSQGNSRSFNHRLLLFHARHPSGLLQGLR